MGLAANFQVCLRLYFLSLLNDIGDTGLKMVAASKKQIDKEDCWKRELRSLGIEPKRKNELNDKGELEALVENMKQVYYQDYQQLIVKMWTNHILIS